MINEILLQLVIFLSNVIQTITGFAGTMLAMPFAIRFVGIEESKTVLAIVAILSCVMIVIKNRKHINYKVLLKIICGMSVGMVVGMEMFKIFPLKILLYGYAVFIILIAIDKIIKLMANPKSINQDNTYNQNQITKNLKNRYVNKKVILEALTLLAAGIIHGMFVSGGALLVLYAISVLKDKDEFRVTVATVWIILDTILLATYWNAGYCTKHCILNSAAAVLALILAFIVGNLLYKKVNGKRFLTISYILLLISGISLLV